MKARKMIFEITLLILKIGKSPIKIGLREYAMDGIYFNFLNYNIILKEREFTGMKDLLDLCKKINRPLVLYTWTRDEYGTTDEAGYIPMDITLTPKMSDVELRKAAELCNERISHTVLIGGNCDFIRVHPVKI